MPILKRDVGIYIVWAVVVGGVGYLIATGKVSWELGAGFLTLLGLPSLLGRKSDDDDDKKDPPAGGATPLFVGMLAVVMTACTPAMLDALRESTADKVQCAIRNMNRSRADIMKICLLEGAPEDIERIFALVGAAREEAAAAAVSAAARQRDLDESVGVCRPEKP